ncbi:hypothetical protein GCM10009616_39250 [Microlunatus lacustris]
MKRKNRVDAARSKTPSVVETVTTTRTERLVPLAQTAAERVAPLYQGVAAKAGPLATGAAAAAGAALPLAHQVYGKAVPLAAGMAAAAVPLAQQAYEKAVPLATGAAAAAGPFAHQAYEKAAPLAGQAVGAVAPYAQAAADKVAPLAEAASLRIAPVVAGGTAVAQDAVSKVGPAFESARDHVNDELLPKVGTALSAAAASPLAVEVVKRGRATAAAARGELTLPEEKAGGSWVKRIAVVAALAGVAVVVRKLLGGSQDSGWQAARPSTPAPSSAPSAPAGDDTVESSPVTEEEITPVAVLKPTSSTYGEGSYTGTEPPEGFVIKGNENSMKYHLPDGGGYAQTVAEVWFDSEESAERAGFTRAQG